LREQLEMSRSFIVLVIGVGYSTNNRQEYNYPAKKRVELRALLAESKRANAKT
jgi:hypothetical protein